MKQTRNNDYKIVRKQGFKMRLDKIIVKNYRLLKDTEIDVEEELSIIIGRNNTGKTSLLKIMNTFLGTSDETLTINDFSIDAQRQLFDLYKKDIEEKPYSFDPISLQLKIRYDATDDISKAAPLIMDLNDKSKILILQFEYGLSYTNFVDLKHDFTNYKNSLKSSNTPNDDFDETKEFLEFVKNNKGYFEKSMYAIDPTPNSNNNRRKLDKSFSLSKVIAMEVIGASREVKNDRRAHSLSSLADEHYQSKKSAGGRVNKPLNELQDLLRKTDRQLTDEYQLIFKSILDDIAKMSYNRNETPIRIESHIKENSLLKDNTLFTYENNSIALPEDHNGLGYMNLFSIIFSINNKIDKLAEKDALINILYLEEPEAHTHPQMQYVFIEHIKKVLSDHTKKSNLKNLQTIMSSHSPQMVSMCDFEDIKYFRRENNNTTISINLSSLKDKMTDSESNAKKEQTDSESNAKKEQTDSESNAKKEQAERAYRFVKQYVTLEKTELFFSEKAILVEGDTERILMHAMMQKLDNYYKKEKKYLAAGNLLSQDIAILSVGAYSQHFKELLSLLGIKTLIITDLDSQRPKTGNSNGFEACDPNDENASRTGNTSLKVFFEEEELNYFVKLSEKNKILSSKDGGRTWQADEEGHLRIAFQAYEGKGAAPRRTFEDAFFAEGNNMNFVAEKKNEFTGLKNKNNIQKDSTDYYNVGMNCISSKPAFALDLLMLDTDEGGITWEIPRYIKEGLIWLQK